MLLKNKFSLLVLLLALGNAGGALAQIQEPSGQQDQPRQTNTSLSDSNDCSNISVDYQNDPNLTQQERIELMDKALFHSLSKYESCQNSRNAAGGGGASGGQGGGGAAGGAGNSGSGTSTASSDLSGTEPSETEPSGTETSAETSTGRAGETTDGEALAVNEETNARAKSGQAKGSGKIPDGIPPVDNDSVLEAQIRQAAMNEQDPIIKEKLWNEYRKYKGLPVKKP